MSLKLKALLILVSVFIVYGFVEYGIQRLIIFPGFLTLEQTEAKKDISRAVQAITREAYHLDLLCHDWSAWDDTYEFINSQSQDYIDVNFVDSTFSDNDLDLIFALDAKNKVIWGKVMDLESGNTIHLPEFPEDIFPASHPLTTFQMPEKPFEEIAISGIYMTRKGPVLVSARPILDSNNQGPVKGTFIMGKFLDNDLVATLVEQTQVSFELILEPLSMELVEIQEQLSTHPLYFSSQETNASFLVYYTPFSDFKGDTAFFLKVKVNKTISTQGLVTIRYAMLSMFFAAMIFLFMVLLLLQKNVLGPLTNLTNHTLSIRETGDLSLRISMKKRHDEIGVLAKEFDNMLQEIETGKIELERANEVLGKDIQHQRLLSMEQKQKDLIKQEAIRQKLLRHTVIAQEEERIRISRELHDETSQALTAAGFTLAALKKRMPSDTESMELVERLQEIDKKMSQGIHRLILNLRPAELDSLGLVSALRSLISDEKKRTGLKVDLKVNGQKQKLDVIVETVLYRIAQESLTNIVRHAGTDNGQIILSYFPEHITMKIVDQGCGFHADEVLTAHHGWGLDGMRERAQSVNGQFQIHSSPDTGTEIKILLPFGDKI